MPPSRQREREEKGEKGGEKKSSGGPNGKRKKREKKRVKVEVKIAEGGREQLRGSENEGVSLSLCGCGVCEARDETGFCS